MPAPNPKPSGRSAFLDHHDNVAVVAEANLIPGLDSRRALAALMPDNPGRHDPRPAEVILHRQGPQLGQVEVLARVADRVGVAVDLERHVAAFPGTDQLVEGCPALLVQVILVEAERHHIGAGPVYRRLGDLDRHTLATKAQPETLGLTFEADY